jgi:D-3-phosphoglycerate dehydrogenase
VLADELDGEIASIPLVEYAKTHDNLVITPHIGGRTIDAQKKAHLRTVRKVVEFFDV